MGKVLNVCTFNVRNDNLIPDLTKEDIENNYHQLLIDYDLDILCTQEMIENTMKIIREKFPNYHIIGDYRYGTGKLAQKIKVLKKYNESTAIITRFPILKTKTIKLPWLPHSLKELYKGIFKYRSLTPRIITASKIKIDQLEVYTINTHLDCHIESIKITQLKKIENLLKKNKGLIILTGDFNTDKEDPEFLKFVTTLKQLGLKRVEYDHKTFSKSKKDLAIDHIFIPVSWQVKEIMAIKNQSLAHYSDHYPIYVKVEIPDNNG